MSGRAQATPKRRPASLDVHCMMLLTAALVSGSYPLGQAITHALDPAVLTFARFVIAILVFLPIVVGVYGLKRPSFSDLGRYAVLSGAYVAFFWCMFIALRHTTALNTAAIFTLVPGISAVFGAVLVGERLGRRRLTALAIGMVGALIVIFRGDPVRLLALDFNIGDFIFFIGGCCFALYTPLVRLLHRGEPMAVMTFWNLIMAALWMVPVANTDLWSANWAAVSWTVWAGIAYLAIPATIFSFFALQFSTMRIGPTRVSAYTYLTPAFVMLIDWAVGNGLPSATTFVGVAIILAAMVIVQRDAGAAGGSAR